MKTPEKTTDHGQGDALHLDDYLPYRLSVASNQVSRLIAKLYQDRFGLSIWQWRVLAILGAHDGLTAGEVAGRAAMDKMAVSRAVSVLLTRKLITRSLSATDGRARILSLTDTGAGIYNEIAPMAQEQKRHLLANFSAREVEIAMKFLRALEARAAELADGQV